MEKTKKIAMTTGEIMPLILTIATPLMFNNIIRTVYNLTDGLYVAQISPQALAATAFIWPVNAIFMAIGAGLSVAGTTFIAQNIGAGQLKQSEEYAKNTLLLNVMFGLICTVVSFFSAEMILSWMGAEGSFLTDSTIYLQINLLALLFDFVYLAYQSILSANGDTKNITRINLYSALINIILDPIFIFEKVSFFNIDGLNMGIAGAAWATVIAKIALCILGYYSAQKSAPFSVKLDTLSINRHVAFQLWKRGYPAMLGQGGSSLGFAMVNVFIQEFGTDTLAAQAMVARVTDIVTQPQMGIGGALTAIIAQNYGAKLYDRLDRIISVAMKLIISISVVLSFIVYVFRYEVLLVFMSKNASENLWAQAIDYLNYTAFIIFFMGLYAAFNGIFQGLGQTRQAMYMSIGRLWVLRIPFIYLFSKFTNLQASGVWIAMLLSNLLTVLFAAIVYYGKIRPKLKKLDEKTFS